MTQSNDFDSDDRIAMRAGDEPAASEAAAKIKRDEMVEALTRLSNEVLGTLPLMEQLARREFGNTNYNILIQRAEEARTLLASKDLNTGTANKIEAGLNEALRFAKGEDTGARVHHRASPPPTSVPGGWKVAQLHPDEDCPGLWIGFQNAKDRDAAMRLFAVEAARPASTTDKGGRDDE